MPPIHKPNRRLRIAVEPHARSGLECIVLAPRFATNGHAGRRRRSSTTTCLIARTGLRADVHRQGAGSRQIGRPAQAGGGGPRGTAGCRSRPVYTHAGVTVDRSSFQAAVVISDAGAFDHSAIKLFLTAITVVAFRRAISPADLHCPLTVSFLRPGAETFPRSRPRLCWGTRPACATRHCTVAR